MGLLWRLLLTLGLPVAVTLLGPELLLPGVSEGVVPRGVGANVGVFALGTSCRSPPPTGSSRSSRSSYPVGRACVTVVVHPRRDPEDKQAEAERLARRLRGR